MMKLQFLRMPSKNALCVISARGGSKGVPNKNITKINGKPLIGYAIEKAFALNIFDHIVVSTDSLKISEIAKEYGAKYLLLDQIIYQIQQLVNLMFGNMH